MNKIKNIFKALFYTDISRVIGLSILLIIITSTIKFISNIAFCIWMIINFLIVLICAISLIIENFKKNYKKVLDEDDK